MPKKFVAFLTVLFIAAAVAVGWRVASRREALKVPAPAGQAQAGGESTKNARASAAGAPAEGESASVASDETAARIAPTRLWGKLTGTTGAPPDRASDSFKAVQLKGGTPVGRTALLDKGSVQSFTMLKPGEEVMLPLPGGETAGRVRMKENTALGSVRVAGELANGTGTFMLVQGTAGLSGRILLPAEKRAVLVHPAAAGQTMLQEVSLSAVVCEALPREPNSFRGTARSAAAAAPAAAPPLLSSRPTAPAVIYLDFDGATVTDPDWPAYASDGITITGPTIVAAPSGLTSAQITEVWNRVKEDYWPFNIDITTDPTRYSSASPGHRMRVIITPTDSASPGAGGVAYTGSFVTADAAFVGFEYFQPDVPAWVFNTSVDGIAEAISHEAGHTLGLHHDGQNPPLTGNSSADGAYYYGHGDPTSDVGWAPIMGAGYYEKLVQWSKGEYPQANNQEDDVAILSGSITYEMIPPYQDPDHPGDPNYHYPGLYGANPTGYVADDAGNALGSAAVIDVSGGTLNLSGIISSAADSDIYLFVIGSPQVITINATPPNAYAKQANLDIRLELQSSGGTVLASSNPDGALNATITQSLAAGTYYIRIAGASRSGVGLDYGYSAYGSIGQYTISGSLVSAVPIITSAATASIGVGDLYSYALTATNSPTSFSATGLPAGLSFDNTTGRISGRPTVTGVFTITLGATNGVGTGSGTLTLTVSAAPPAVLSQTVGRQVLTPGSNLTLTASALSFNGTVSYQWFHDGQPVPGATDSALALSNLSFNGGGAYWLAMTNSIGTSRSAPIFVLVAPAATQVRGWGYSGASPETTPPVGLNTAVSVSAGAQHVLAIRADGTVVGWGYSDPNITAIPASLTDAVAVAAGFNHSVALKSDGTVVVWGSGQPWDVPPAGLRDVVAIAAGYYYSLALKTDGTVVGWGNPDYDAEVVPAGLTGVVAISAGGYTSAAVKNDGTVLAWGQEYYGPTAAFGAIKVAVGTMHGLILKNDGTVVGWGYDGWGAATIPSGLSGVRSISAGYNLSLAAKSDGTVVAWGDLTYATPPGDLADVVAVSAGFNYALALRDITNAVAPIIMTQPASLTRAEGQNATFSVVATGAGPFTYQWRKNGTPISGETGSTLTFPSVGLGDAGNYDVVITNLVGPTTSNQAALVVNPVPVITGLGDARRGLTAGQGLFLSVSATGTGPLSYQWFRNGRAIPGATTGSYARPSAVYQDSGWYVVDVTDTNGTRRSSTVFAVVTPANAWVVGWGNNVYGQVSVPANLNSVAAVAEGGSHSLALRLDGSVVAWGYNSQGQCNPPGGLTDVVAIAACGNASAAVKADGTVVAWGNNEDGQTAVPAGLNNVVAIAGAPAGTHFLALRSNGTVAAWGNGAGAVPSGLSGVVAITTVGSHNMATKADGTIVTWGSGGTNPPAAVTGIVGGALGSYHGIALKNDATVLTWGDNTYGQATVPTGLSDVVAVSAGFNHNVALKIDGTVAAWGKNDFGQRTLPAGLVGVLAISSGSDSNLALLSNNNPPTITVQPQNLTVLPGSVATFGAAATGGAPITFLWQRLPAGSGTWANLANGGAYAGVTTTELVVTNVALEMQGDQFRCVASNPGGSRTTNPAMLSLSGPAAFVAVSPGYAHILFIAGNGALWGIGSNSNGQLGVSTLLGDSVGPTTPVPITTGVAKLGTLNGWHSLFIKTDGTLWGMGNNANGQLGDGTIVQRNTPVQIPGATDVTAASAGIGHSIFLKTDGSLWAMGDNQAGALGDTTFVQRKSPVQVATGVAAVSAGSQHSLFLKTDGTLWAMGANGEGQLGDGTQTNRSTPVQVASGVAKIAAGNAHSLFVKTDGTLWAMGANYTGQLGDGTTARRISPVQVATGVTAIAAGSDHSVFLKTNGTLWGMGLAGNGALGGDGYYSGNKLTPVQIAGGVLSIAAGGGVTGFIKTDGTFWTLGDNHYGQLGVGNTINQSTPYRVTVLPMVAVDGYRRQTRAVGGSVNWSVTAGGYGPFTYQWYRNGRPVAGATNSSLPLGSVGYADSGWYVVDVTSPIGTTRSGAMFLTVAPYSTQLAGWGYNVNGQISIPAGLNDALDFAAGNLHSLALRQNGTVVAWGNSSDLTTIPEGLDEVVDLAAGQDFSLALRSDGTVRAWGTNFYNELNIPTGLVGVVSISAGYQHSLALRADGTVVAWGSTNTSASTAPPGLTGVIAVAAGATHSLALKSDGTVMAWGTNTNGQASVPPGLANVISIAAGGSHSLALKSDGTVVAWGANPWGQCTVPPSLTGVVAISAGMDDSLALKSDGTIVAWGSNYGGYADLTPFPAGLTNVLGISAGTRCWIAMRDATGDAAPNITAHPQAQSVPVGNSPAFTVTATGGGVLNYRWQRLPVGSGTWVNLNNGSPYWSTTTATLSIDSASLAMSGDQFRVVVSNSAGSVTSNVATLSLITAVPPAITSQPSSQTVSAGGSVAFTVAASGTPSPTYQWQRLPAGGGGWSNLGNGGAYSGTTTVSLTVGVTTMAMNGDQFRCVATNAAGSATSDAATLTVTVSITGNGNAIRYDSTDFPTTASAGSTVSFTYNVTNLGTKTWGAGHYLTMRDASGTYVAYGNLGTTAAGAGKAVSMSFPAPATPGTYTYYLRAMDYGVEFFGPELPLSLTVQVVATVQGNAIRYDSTTFPATAGTGATVSFTYDVTNLGTKAWGTNHYLTLRDQNGTYIAYASLSGVAINGSKVASLSFTAPVTPGTYTYTVQALENGVEFFGPQLPLSLTVQVVATVQGNAIRYDSTTFPATAETGATVSFTYDVTNLGTKAWGANHYLTLRNEDGTYLDFPSLNGVMVNGSKTATFTFSTPMAAGTYTYYVEAVENEVELFGPVMPLTLIIP